ncbi:hypothetical protein JK628_07805 [Shewanella sp. KX20019]|uniref:hypothetical protein n=1 Tax=Shewanella sp. KX20019 TaxID=2803864 RepID=UPI001929115C|nr:hypothetical protein [Shewanella sp. KX20019]QQX81730.1 hypothetical protein JK628_07805 [Shewanella sp. KX20019]
MSLLRTISLYFLLVFLLWGCAVDKRPDHYVSAISVSSSLAAHASSLPQHSDLQNALKHRNLIISETGEVLPINQSVCQSQLFYRVTQAAFPQYVGKHQDLFSGFYIDVARVNNNWVVVDTDNDFAQIQSQTPSQLILNELLLALTPKLMIRDVIIIRPESEITRSNLKQLIDLIEVQLPKHPLQFVVPEKYVAQVEKSGFKAVSDGPAKSDLYLAPTPLTSDARKRILMSVDSFNVAEPIAIVVDTQPLMACMQANKSVVLAPTQKIIAPPANVNAVLLANVLPSNADFNRLDEQQRLLSSGQYLTIDNQQQSYPLSNQVDSNRCRHLKSGDALYQYCLDRQQDGETAVTTQKYIMKKKQK